MATTYKVVAGWNNASSISAASPLTWQPKGMSIGYGLRRFAPSGLVLDSPYSVLEFQHVNQARLATILSEFDNLSPTAPYKQLTARLRNDQGNYVNMNVIARYPELGPDAWNSFRYPTVRIVLQHVGVAS